MGLAELRADAKLHRERIAKMKLADLPPEKLGAVLKLELVENIFPMFEGLVDALEEDYGTALDDLNTAVDQLIDQSSDLLQPQTAAQILGVFELGKLLANELEALAKQADDVSRKRIAELVLTYRRGAEVVGTLVAGITLDEDDEDPATAGAQAEPGGDDDDGDDGDEEEAAND